MFEELEENKLHHYGLLYIYIFCGCPNHRELLDIYDAGRKGYYEYSNINVFSQESPPTPSSDEVKERVELYLYSPSETSWPVLGQRKRPFPYICHFRCGQIFLFMSRVPTYFLPPYSMPWRLWQHCLHISATQRWTVCPFDKASFPFMCMAQTKYVIYF